MAAHHHIASRGFTLIELMVTVVIAGILAAIAYPAYTAHVQRSRRADAVALLSAVTQAQERYRTNRVEYARNMSDLNLTVSAFTSHYTLTLAGVGSPANWTVGYVATASAASTSPQANDAKCASMGIQLDGSVLSYFASDSAGNDSSTTCWPR